MQTAAVRKGPVALSVLGTVRYRAGQHEAAVRTLEDAVTAATNDRERLRSWLYLALAETPG